MNTFTEELKMKGVWRYFIAEDGEIVSKDEQSRLLAGEDIGRKVRVHIFNNVITAIGRKRMNETLAGQIATVDEGKITHQELGTDTTTTPSASDTQMVSPTGSTRSGISSLGVSDNVLNITSFWSAGTATGTWKRHGTFINGSATTNSGILFSHLAIDLVVSAGEGLTVDGTVTMSI